MLRAVRLQAGFVDPRAAARARVKQLLMVWIANYANQRFAVAQDGKGYAPVMQAVKEAGGAVDGIHHPYPARALDLAAALFPQHRIVREAFGNQGFNQLFDVAVRLADHIL